MLRTQGPLRDGDGAQVLATGLVQLSLRERRAVRVRVPRGDREYAKEQDLRVRTARSPVYM